MPTRGELNPNPNIWGQIHQTAIMNHVKVGSSAWSKSKSSDSSMSTGSKTSESSDSDSGPFDADVSSVRSVESFRSNSTCTLVGCTDVCIHYQQSLERKIDSLTSDIEHLNHSISARDRDNEHQKFNTNQMEFTIDALKGDVAMLECAVQNKIALVEAEAKEKMQQVDVITGLYSYIGKLQKKAESTLHKTPNASEAKSHQNALEDELSQCKLALEDENERRRGLEEHIIDMGRRKYSLKKENRKMRLATVEKDKSLEKHLAEKKSLRTKMVELELEIEELHALVSGLLGDAEAKVFRVIGLMKEVEHGGGECEAGEAAMNDEVVLLEVRKALSGRVPRKELNKAALVIVQRLRKLWKL